MIQCDLGFGDERLGYLFTLGDGAPHVERGWDGEAAATVRQDLVDLLRELFGPAGPYGVTRELSAKEYANSEYSPSVAAGMWPMVGAMSHRPKDLSELAARFGSDKWGGRWYTPHYQKHFEPYRELAVKVLEIGIGGYDAIRLDLHPSHPQPTGHRQPATTPSARRWTHQNRPVSTGRETSSSLPQLPSSSAWCSR